METNTDVSAKNIFGLKSYYLPAIIVIIILLIFDLFVSQDVPNVPKEFSVLLTIFMPFVAALLLNWGAKKMGVENRSFDKALFITTTPALINGMVYAILSLLGNGFIIVLISFIIGFIIVVKITKSIYIISNKKAIVVLLYPLLIIFGVVAVIGLFSSILLASLRSARTKALQQTQIPTEPAIISETTNSDN